LARDKKAILLELLVLRCKRGEKQAFDELIRQWERRLFFFVRRLVASEVDASDVLQETWVKVLKGIKALDDPHRLSTWLYRIARRTAASHWRSRYREQARLEDNADTADLAEVEEDWHFEDAEQVHRALSRVSLAHREVLTLHFIDDLSLEQMADILAVPLGTVKSRLCYAKRALRFVLKREEGEL
jgi:RNA polymerase sigma-70 factor (ECF subfamily)